MPDRRQYAPSTARNREPIAEALRSVLPPRGLALEIASGSGEHAIHFASQFPAMTFQPSDPSPEARDSIAAWIAASGARNLLAPLAIDASQDNWPVTRADAVICINMIHISPWAAAEGLMRNAAKLLPAGAPLFLYGPYKRGGEHTASSNAEFDRWLRAQNAEWGVRDLDAVIDLARDAGFAPPRLVDMPANNLSVIFHRQESG